MLMSQVWGRILERQASYLPSWEQGQVRESPFFILNVDTIFLSIIILTQTISFQKMDKIGQFRQDSQTHQKGQVYNKLNQQQRMNRKYLDRNLASRYSLTRSTSPSLLPPLSPRRLDDFTLSVKRHLTRTQNPEQPPPLHSIRYYMQNELSSTPEKEETKMSNILTSRRQTLLNDSRQQSYKLSLPSHLKERPDCEVYAQRVEENVKKYGQGMLRRRHLNALTVSSKEGELLELHYRLKKQRERVIIEKEEREGSLRLKELLSRYDSI